MARRDVKIALGLVVLAFAAGVMAGANKEESAAKPSVAASAHGPT
jgi:hypothetical protein